MNYGDLLFPIVARHYLGGVYDEIFWISPKGGAPVCEDAVETLGVKDIEWIGLEFDLALIGGGNIVTSKKTKLPDYAAVEGLDLIAYPSLWLAACLKAADCGAAIAWNAPGLMQANWGGGARSALLRCMELSEYISFRELDRLDWVKGDIRARMRLVPDTVITLSRIWPGETLSQDYEVVRDRCELGKPYFVVHLKARNCPSKADRLAAARAIDRMALDTGLTPVLLPIGRCHGDEEFLSLIALAMNANAVLAGSVTGLRETTALIANARYVFAASLHCAIVAASYGVPSNLLETPHNPKYRAFFEGHLGSETTVVTSIEQSLDATARDRAEQEIGRLSQPISEAADAVERHFAAIASLSAATESDRLVRKKSGRRAIRAIEKAAPVSPYLPIGAVL